MYVTKRNGEKEDVSYDKILTRVRNLSSDLHIDPFKIARRTIDGLIDGISTAQLDELAASYSSSLGTEHPDYCTLASRIIISNMHKNTFPHFSDAMWSIYTEHHDKSGRQVRLLSDDVYAFIERHQEVLNKAIKDNRDYLIDYFGYKTLERAYLIRVNGVPVERPQYLFLRASIGMHYKCGSLKDVIRTYNDMSKKYFIHATPTLFNSGSLKPQMSSCFLVSMKEDSIEGIYDTLKQCALISKSAGGIGINVHSIRARGSMIRGTNGESDGITPMLKVFNDTARYVDQGGGKRKGSFAVYIEPHHADIEDFLDLRKKQGAEDFRAKDLFYALWVPDLFMKRVKNDEIWSLMCPDQCPGLFDSHSDEFEKLYEKYEKEGNFVRQIKARDLYKKIIVTQIEEGMPYMLYKDHCNRKSNQQNLGTIRSSNLCVHPDTKILTDTGYHSIIDLANKAVNVWNGFEYSEVTPVKTGENEEMYKVEFSSGQTVVCTGYHKFYIDTGKFGVVPEVREALVTKSDKLKIVSTKDLEIGMKLIKHFLPNNKEVSNDFITIKSVTKLSEKSDTYCFKEPILGTGMFNGVLLGNCTEIIQYSSADETAVCNLASISLPSCLKTVNGEITFNFKKLCKLARHLVYNLNHVIDTSYYPTKECEKSNLRHRPMGVGVQGLANVFSKMGLPFTSETSKQLNKDIFETIYYGALKESCKLAKKHGTYASYPGSPASKGILQYDMWNTIPSDRWDFDFLKRKIKKYGLRNSLLIAPMPTASTSQILGNNECFECFTTNIYTRRTLAGEFTIINKDLLNDLIEMGIWSNEIKDKILYYNGSVQKIEEIPDNIKEIYKTVWEIPQMELVQMSADRAPYVDQSQSFNIHIGSPTIAEMSSLHMKTWELGLKTGMYYLRTNSAVDAVKSNISVALINKMENKTDIETDGPVCMMEDGCLMCGA